MDEKKACPFCGSVSMRNYALRIGEDEYWGKVECTQCYATVTTVVAFTTADKARSAAVMAWNRRK